MNYTNNYRRNLALYWRQFYPEWTIPKGYHVHHIKPRCTFEDKNDPRIHHPSNLIALHPDDHVTIHLMRGDKAVATGFMSVRGYTHSEETRRKISIGNTGKKATSAQRAKMSIYRKGAGNSFYGRKHTAKTKLKQSQSHKGCGLGVKVTDETKLKISQTKTGVNRKPFTKEHKAKLSLALKGRKCKPFTTEHKEKLKQAKIAYHAKNKLK